MLVGLTLPVYFSYSDTMSTRVFFFVASLIIGLFVVPQSFTVQAVTLGQWQTSPEFNFRSHPVPSFAIGSYYYVMKEGAVTDMYYAKQGAGGALMHPDTGSISDVWKQIRPGGGYGSSPHGTSAIAFDGSGYYFRNGYIIRAVQDAANGEISRVVELEDPGRRGFDGEHWFWNSLVYAPFTSGQRYIYQFGGWEMDDYRYKQDIFYRTAPFPNPDGNSSDNNFADIGSDSPFERPGKAAFYQIPGQTYGYAYLRVGNGNSMKRVRVNSDGSLGSWEDVPAIPSGSGNGRGDVFVVDGTMFAISGSKVFSADLGSTGDVVWDSSSPDLPDEQIDEHWGGEHVEGASYGFIGNYVYVTGKRNVYYAQINGAANPTDTPVPTATPSLAPAGQATVAMSVVDGSGVLVEAEYIYSITCTLDAGVCPEINLCTHGSPVAPDSSSEQYTLQIGGDVCRVGVGVVLDTTEVAFSNALATPETGLEQDTWNLPANSDLIEYNFGWSLGDGETGSVIVGTLDAAAATSTPTPDPLTPTSTPPPGDAELYTCKSNPTAGIEEWKTALSCTYCDMNMFTLWCARYFP